MRMLLTPNFTWWGDLQVTVELYMLLWVIIVIIIIVVIIVIIIIIVIIRENFIIIKLIQITYYIL